MATYIKTLSDKDGNVILPKTRATAVYVGNNETVESWLGALKASTDSKLPLSGGTMTGPVKYTSDTGTYLRGNQGVALVSSDAASTGRYVTFLRYKTTNGIVTVNGYTNRMIVGYTSNTTISGSQNKLDYQYNLITESGQITEAAIIVNDSKIAPTSPGVRNIFVSTSIPSSLANGRICLVYQ